MKKTIRITAAYVISYLLTFGLIKLAMATAKHAESRSTGLPSDLEGMRQDAAMMLITFGTPFICGLLSGLVFTMLTRPKVLLHACIFSALFLIYSIIGSINPDYNSALVIIVQLLYPAALIASAAACKKIAEALSS